MLGAAREISHLMIHHREGFSIAIDHIESGVRDFEQLAARIASRPLMNRGQRFDQLRHHRFGYQNEDVFLALQINVDGTGGEAGFECEFLDAGLVKRFARQHTACGEENLPPPRLHEGLILRLSS